jgi:hypothetical protein
MDEINTNKIATIDSGPESPIPNSPNRKLKWIMVGAVLLLLLAAAAYLLFKPKNDGKSESRISQAWLTQYFHGAVCTEESTCGETADPDKDGLTNYEEFTNDTIPTNPDSDDDKLADGDEIKIYKTNPKNKFTDKREVAITKNWTDDYEIKGGYDPLTPGELLTSSRKQEIENATEQFSLHEPTLTTIATVNIPLPVASPNPASPILPTANWKIYTSNQYGFEFEYPGAYSVRSEYQYVYVEDPKTSLKYTFEIYDNSQTLNAMDYANSALLDFDTQREPIKKLNLNGIEAAETELSQGNINNRLILFPVKNKMVQLQYHLDDNYFVNRDATDQKQTYIKNGETLVSSIRLAK